MTDFVGAGALAGWLTDQQIEEVLADLAECIETDYLRWNEFSKTHRIANHTPFGVIELMPISDPDLYAFKYVNGHPSNPARGYQTVTAFGVLASVHNGYPIFVAEMTLLTALRTAATSAMVARHLARRDSKVMALIGAGSQSEFQALAFRSLLGVTEVRVFDVDERAMAKITRNLVPLGFDVICCSSAREAASGADIVTTCTADKANAKVLQLRDVSPGMHINAIGGDCPGKTELDPRILERGLVFVEYEPQSRIEGEIQQMPPDFEVSELADLLAGRVVGRRTERDITVFDSVGFAIEDFSALRYLRERIAGTSAVEQIELVAAPNDPKDLFGLTLCRV